jgi:hypothetical protein
MTLREQQSLFARLLVDLFIYIHQHGYEITLGDAHRSIEEATRLGKSNSVHTLSLALDINLFQHGVFLSDTSDHKIFGEYWKTLHPLCRWGGDFGDGNHYSLEYNGVK